MKPLLLVVDDDIDDIEFVKGAISEISFPLDLRYFFNATELLLFFKEMTGNALPPMVITLDINLPGINGIELLKILKRDYGLQHIPISMVTTSNSIEQKKKCLEYGACHFFTKPVKTSDWKKIIDSLMNDFDGKNYL
jgi:chemotaxis family two-component system response regulator Rcp1